MNGGLAWALVALGVGVVVARRRSVAVALVTIQALVLAAAAVTDASDGGEVAAAMVLAFRAGVLGAVLIARTREPRPVPAHVSPLVRAVCAVTLALVLAWLVPPLGFAAADVEHAALALVAFGLVTVATRRATLLQLVGIVLVENGVALAALELPGAASLLTEVGVACDLALLVAVAAVFHERIFVRFGAGDSSSLRALRD